MNTHLLQHQVAIVTGAGRGIGRATALALAGAGAAVVLAARSGDEIACVADEIKYNGGGPVLSIPTDISEVAEVDHLLVLTMRAFGRIDILVNNAALVHPLGKVWETSPAAWQKLLAVNVLGPYLCARAVLPHMLERGSGRIINISSALAEVNLAGASAYNVSKAALERFSGTLAIEVKETGLSVTTLRPGAVDTQMQADIRQTPAKLFPKSVMFQSLYERGQLLPPVEPARAILWLASPFAEQTNGQLFDLTDTAFQQRMMADFGLWPAPALEHNGANHK